MIRFPDVQRLAQQLRRTATLLDDHGTLMAQRASDWTQPPRQGEGHQWTRGGGLSDPDQPSDDARTDRLEDHRAGRYHDELTTLLARLDADSARLAALQRILIPDSPQRLGTADMQIAQLVVDGWCGSCARDTSATDEPHLQAVAAGRYADRCRFCGDFRAEHKQDPPLQLLKAKHKADREGKRLSTKVVDAALGRTA